MNPEEIVREFQKRQKRVVVAALTCFALAAPLAMRERDTNPVYSAEILVVAILLLFGFYLLTYRCPACGTRAQQRRRMLRMPIHCKQCGVLLDPK